MPKDGLKQSEYKCVLSEAEQVKHLGMPTPTDCNLGYQVPVDKLADNPAKLGGKSQGTVAARGLSGIASQKNLDAWADYAKKNSYLGNSIKPK
jgi:hypothetical protein